MGTFNPAPIDKYGDRPGARAARARKERSADDRLEEGLKETFPASDPVSVVRPAQSVHDRAPRQTPRHRRRGPSPR